MKKERVNIGLEWIQLNEGQLPWLPKNPRKWTQTDIDKTAASIKEDPDFLEDRPLLVVSLEDTPYFIVFAGNLRSEGAKAAGRALVPCVLYTPEKAEDYETIRRRAMKDNGSFGQFDWDEVFSSPWGQMDLDAMGIGKAFQQGGDPFNESAKDETREQPQAQEDDFDENADAIQVRCKPGDVWQLGEHRLMCGDSIDLEQVKTLMGGAKIDLLMADPPYGINADKMTMGTGRRNYLRGEWDDNRPDISQMIGYAKDVCIWGGNYFADILPVTNDWLCWYKNNDGLSFSEFELAWTNFGRNCRHITHHWGAEKKLHVTMKPVEVIAWAIRQTKEDCRTILDLFGGSGTTMIAAEELGKICYMMEIDPHFCDVILARWEKLTGKTAVKVSA